MIGFILTACVIALATTLAVARPLLGGRRTAPGRETADAQVFRDQLAELERDLGRGLISPNEAEGARIEISRRLIQSDQRAQTEADLAPGPVKAARTAAIAALVAVPVMAATIYVTIGSPGQPDAPLTARLQAVPERPSQQEAEAATPVPLPREVDPEYAALITQLEQVVATRPDDARGQQLLGNALLRVGRFADARRAYDRHLELAGSADAATHASHAEAMIMATAGYVSPEAEQAIARALEVDPEHPMARYYAGIALRQAGRADQAIAIWERLLAEAPMNAPWRAALAEMVAATQAPGRNAALPELSDEQQQMGAEMTPEERAAFIAERIASLEERLTTEGGEVEEWARLMFVYVQNGQPDEAVRVYALGRDAQLENTAKSFLKEQAILLGLDVQ